MKELDLSKIKVVGFIPNFNPKCGYPEYGYNNTNADASPTTSPKYDFNVPLLKEKKHKPQAKHIKNAKRAWKKANGHLKSVTTAILDYKLESSSDIVWRTN